MPSSPLAAVTPRCVVVTGMSVGSALGFELDEFWKSLLGGQCGIRRLPFVTDDSPLRVKVAGRIPEDLLAAALKRLEIDDPDRGNQLGLYAVGRALEDAGLPTNGKSPLDYDVIVGTGHGNVLFHNAALEAFFAHGYRKMRPTSVVRLMFNRPANIASIRYQLTGASHVVSAACATGAVAFSEAFERVRFGLAEGAVAACCDSGLDLPTFAAWNRLGVLSRIPEPERASRPFDQARDGLVMGEGAAAFVLETLESAERRGARIRAEVVGTGASSDAKHIVQPDSAGQVRAVRKALTAAGVTAADIDYINAHGTATELADIAEATTLREVFGPHCDRIPVTNTKAQLGHLMGATAGVELLTTILIMEHGLIPPSRNLDDPDPRCPLNFVRGEPLKARVNVALKNSFAFGGSNCAVVLRRWT